MDPSNERPSAPGWLVWVALWIVYIVWGSTYLAIRITVETLPPLLSAAVRFGIAGIVMFAFLALRRGPASLRVTRRELGACAVVGAALLLGGNGLVSIAELEVPSALAALLIASTPLWVVLLRAVTGDRVSGGTLAGVGLGFVGVAILVLPGASGGGRMVGYVLLLIAAALWALGSFLSSRLSLPSDPFTSTTYQMMCGGAALTLGGALRGEFSGLDVGSFSGASLAALAYLIVIGSWLAFSAYTWLLQNAPISKVATYAYVNPVVAVFLGWLILSEEITGTILLGAAVIVVSVAFIVRKESGTRPAPDVDEVAPVPAAVPADG